MTKKISFYTLKFILLSAAAILPFLIIIIIGIAVPSQFEKTFLGELSDKFERLNSIDEPKIVIIGGSSTAFGFDSEMIEEYMGMPVVNFGLYAEIGTKAMLDLSKSNINEGDIIIVAPEINTQTLSLYFNAESMWQAVDSDINILFHLGYDNAGEMVGEFFNYVGSKIKYMNSGGLNPDGVYSRSSFNDFGDIVYERPYNIMALGYDPNTSIVLSSEIIEPEFIDYLNDYTKYVQRRGADVYFSFPPMNESALSPDTTDESIAEFFSFIAKSLDCEIITNINDCIMNENYFYDSNFHLNDTGVFVHTADFIGDLRRVKGDTRILRFEYPEIPERPQSVAVSGNNENTNTEWETLFTYEEFASGLMINGVTDEAIEMKTLEIPVSSDGKAILAIGEGALKNCVNLESITIPSSILQLYDGIFNGCSSLKSVYLKAENPENIKVGDKLFEGAPDNTLIYLNEEQYGLFISNYFWAKYTSRMTVY